MVPTFNTSNFQPSLQLDLWWPNLTLVGNLCTHYYLKVPLMHLWHGWQWGQTSTLFILPPPFLLRHPFNWKFPTPTLFIIRLTFVHLLLVHTVCILNTDFVHLSPTSGWVAPLLYSDCLRRESNFLASTRQVTALCVCVCCILCVCNCAMVIRESTRKQCNIRTRTRQWRDTLKPKS